MSTAQDIIQDALEKIGVYAPGETMTDADAERGLTVLNDMLDSWSNESLACYANVEQSNALTSGKNQYSIGSGGDFDMTRPLDILVGPGAAYLQDANGNNFDVEVVTQDRWNMIGNRSTSITSNIPDTLFYDPQYPLGKINVFPTPNLNYTLFWDSRLQFTEFSTLTSTVSLPPGYLLALKSNLAIFAWPYFKPDDSTPSPLLISMAREAKGIIKRTNMKTVQAVYPEEIVARSSATYNIYRDK